jgi:hypothetical protein
MWPLPAYDARCLLIGLEVLSDRRIVASFFYARDILVGKVECADLAFMLQFKEVPWIVSGGVALLHAGHKMGLM